MAKSLDSNSKFNIYSSFTLSNDDVATLSLLYTPLIGSEALMLYLGFASLLERNNLKSEEMIHQDLFEIYSLNKNSFLKARHMLEGIGLLTVYYNDESYLYVLSSPLTAKNFIKDATLGLYLYSKVRKETFENIYNHFKIERIDKSKYDNITKSFDEVFKSDTSNEMSYDKFKYILGKVPNKNIKIKDYGFDFDSFAKEINLDYLETGITKTFKDQICNLAFVYSFSEMEMLNLYNDSLNKSNLYDYRLLKNKANVLFNYKRNMKAPKLTVVSEDNVLDKELCEYLEKTPISQILEDASPNYPPKYLSTCVEVYSLIDLPKGVINCMILKVLKDKSGELPSLSYFKKMSETWIADNIFSTIDAVKYVTTFEKPTNSFSAISSKEPDNGGFREL